jgi:hypothetical protein
MEACRAKKRECSCAVAVKKPNRFRKMINCLQFFIFLSPMIARGTYREKTSARFAYGAARMAQSVFNMKTGVGRHACPRRPMTGLPQAARLR